MITIKMLMVLCLAAANTLPPEAGSIGGVVVNVTQGEAPVSGALEVAATARGCESVMVATVSRCLLVFMMMAGEHGHALPFTQDAFHIGPV